MSDILSNGWTAVPLDASKLFDGKQYRVAPEPLSPAEIVWPSDDPVVAEMETYAKEHLSLEIYNHSMRVYYFATTILKQQFREFATTLSPATLALTCLLHDLGATEANMAATNMSFEFYGGIESLRVLEAAGAPTDQAAAVCECIIRHQDIGVDGSITLLGQLVQLATVYDNAGEHPHLAGLDGMIHEDTREAVVAMFPRRGWLRCFAEAVRTETARKPWCHTTHIPGFAEKILANKLMAQYE
ncbi:Cyanamide hydratase, HD-type [Cordyceps fumosorosea ARSEF 2679]|uniref:Cyanamide hydratase, HD-type n=1 Tax=Cordyceps fumosorosea (strain ARSEF 2679) TaxID=1081104 RepID=A0A167PM22_CORFA|nr:Cyanamide hydratase, HD-type [Cordyceps fumosorosea ARSEF 2679]OAA56804.1 Cyanamide hydratase, HD-type [Cordyceps fumosorosea ARSEF 2679]